MIVEGPVAKIAREESETYFHSRPRPSQLAAWAAQQSSIVTGRAGRSTTVSRRWKGKYAGQPVPVPPHWGGYRLSPETVEFWQGRRSRLHDRLRYRRASDGGWLVERLAP